MFDKNYTCSPKGIPFVAYYKEILQGVGSNFTKFHFHDDFELLYICEGCAEFNIDGKTFTCDRDTLVVVNPYETHSAKVLRAPLCYYCLDFDFSILGAEYEKLLLKEKIKFQNVAHLPEGRTQIENACNAYFDTPCGWQSSLRGNLLLVFSDLEKSLQKKTPDENAFVKDVILYVERNLSESVTSKTAAKELGYDQSYFCRIFKKNFGESFGNYRNVLRVERAKGLLKQNSVTKTAQQCGFPSVSMFSQTFKKHTGLSPAQYKKETYRR